MSDTPPFVSVKLPAALALYWAMASLVAIGQQSIELKKDVRDLEKAK